MKRPVLSIFAAVSLLHLSVTQASHLEKIQATNELKVCIWPDYYGISYRNPKTLQLSGIDIDMALALGQELRVPVRFIDSSFANLINDIEQDKCDIAMFAIGITAQRSEHLRFTRPHLVSDIYAIATRSNRRIQSWADIDKPGTVVAVAKGTLHESVMHEKLKHATLLVTSTPQGREQEVEAGRADVFMTDYPFSRRMLETTDWARMVAPPSTYHLTHYAYAMQKGDDTFYQRVSVFLNKVRADGRLLAAIKRYKLDPIAVP